MTKAREQQINNTLEGSDFTSIQDRLFDIAQLKNNGETINKSENNIDLLCFNDDKSLNNESQKGLPFSLPDYVELIDWTGRIIRDDKKGAIPSNILPILQKLGVNDVGWVGNVNHFGRGFYHVVGAIEAMRNTVIKSANGGCREWGFSSVVYRIKFTA